MKSKTEKQKTKTYSREVTFALLIFLSYLTYMGKTQVSDWITPVTVLMSLSFGAKQEAVLGLVDRGTER